MNEKKIEKKLSKIQNKFKFIIYIARKKLEQKNKNLKTIISESLEKNLKKIG
jgi:hypothetical protein